MPTLALKPHDYGYSQYKNRRLEAGTTVDLTGSTFLTQQLPDFRNAYPVNVGGGKDCAVVGARVLGTTTPLDASWAKRYNKGRHNSAGIVVTNPVEFTVRNVRVHDCWDAIRFAGINEATWTLEDAWISRNHDDWLENDSSQRREGLIRRVLVDGTYMGISTTAGGSRPGKVRVEDTLMRMQPFVGAHNDGPKLQPGHKQFFKMRKDDVVDLVRCVFRLDQLCNSSAYICAIPPDKKRGGGTIWPLGECRENVMVWTGKGDYPYKLPKGFEVVKNIKFWDDAVSKWLKDHPDVPRFDFDPKPAKPPEPTGYLIRPAEKVMKVDTDLSEYAEAMPLYAETGNATLKAQMMWSDAGLHFGIQVVDPEVIADTITEKLHRQDSVEIFIDPTGDGGSSMSAGDIQIFITPQGRASSPVPVETAVALISGGYIIEVMVPWPKGFNRDRCRISFALNDGKHSVLLGGETSGFQVPDKWLEARCASKCA